MKAGGAVWLACVLVMALGLSAGAQTLPSAPLVLGNGVVTIGGDATASFGRLDPGFFNYTDYRYSSLRRIRAGLTAVVNAGQHLSVLGELEAETATNTFSRVSPKVFALYARFRPWTSRRFDIQAGRIPPTFGAFTRRVYASDNPLIGYPLGYQYLTSLRPDALPADADDLLGMRGRGWLSRFPVGDLTRRHGVPLATAFRWDTGIQVHAASDLIEATASLTRGTLSNPLFKDDNDGRQVAARVAVHPSAGLAFGASASHGPFVSTSAARAAVGSDAGAFTQTAWGADAEYSHGYYLVRAEAIVSQWTIPQVRAPFIGGPLRAAAASVEGRYKIMPGLYAAARVEHLGFSTITGSAGSDTWDAPVTRVEVGGGYSLQRNLLLKFAYQFDKRDTARNPKSHLMASEIVFWF